MQVTDKEKHQNVSIYLCTALKQPVCTHFHKHVFVNYVLNKFALASIDIQDSTTLKFLSEEVSILWEK